MLLDSVSHESEWAIERNAEWSACNFVADQTSAASLCQDYSAQTPAVVRHVKINMAHTNTHMHVNHFTMTTFVKTNTVYKYNLRFLLNTDLTSHGKRPYCMSRIRLYSFIKVVNLKCRKKMELWACALPVWGGQRGLRQLLYFLVDRELMRGPWVLCHNSLPWGGWSPALDGPWVFWAKGPT